MLAQIVVLLVEISCRAVLSGKRHHGRTHKQLAAPFLVGNASFRIARLGLTSPIHAEIVPGIGRPEKALVAVTVPGMLPPAGASW